MHKLKAAALLTMGLLASCLFSGCGSVDATVLNTPANYSVDISVPYATATPLPEYLNVPDAIVIDSEGSVTLNDESLLANNYSTDDGLESSQYSNLALGDTGLAVQSLQQRLKDLGYYTAGVSGVFDDATERAVCRFEQTYGLMQTGIATPVFQARLFSGSAPVYGSKEYDSAVVSQYTTLQRGAVGSSVYALQHRLKELGYPITDLSGVYDEETEEAVRQFYIAYDLEPQSVAYITLQKELYSEMALPYAEEGQASNETTIDKNALSLGNVGTLVMQLQERLFDLGYMHSAASGIFDAETEAAVRLFEEACDRTPTGILSSELQSILLSDGAPAYGSTFEDAILNYTDLAVGSEGEDVVKLQERLVELGYATGVANGIYGSATASSLRVFQRANGLEATGVATAYVQSRLFAASAIAYGQTQGADDASQESVQLSREDIASRITTFEDPVGVYGATDELSLYGKNLATLAIGSSGDDVQLLQERLIELGYTCASDGVFDETTASAVREMQRSIGVTQTGEVSASMQLYLYSNAAPRSGFTMSNSTQVYTLLQEGDTGESVTQLQYRLWELGYLLTENVEDSIGAYHQATRLAVASAQLAMGYEAADGVAGPEFQCFIFSKHSDLIKK